LVSRLGGFVTRFGSRFRSKTRSGEQQALKYVKGLIQSRRANMERMAELLPETDEQALHHFISNATWDARGVIDQVAVDADAILGGHEDSMLILDDSGFPKKGKHSVGVSRQYCGQSGKVDNCQVGVFGALCHGNTATLVDARLFLPESWIKDGQRCTNAGVPAEEQVRRTKHDLAKASIAHLRELGVRFRYVGFDAGYGESGVLLRKLDEDGVVFFADVHKSQQIFIEKPREGAEHSSVLVEEWVAAQPPQAWKQVTLRDGTKGPITVEILHRRIWLRWATDPRAYRWHLIVRREIAAPDDIKYTLSNAPADLPRQRLAYLQGQRYWVERCFEDAKQQVGMGDYQVRGWNGWHHHMAMVLMAMLFLLETKVALGQEVPVTSADIEWLLRKMLPTRGNSDEELLHLLERRIRKRTASSPPPPPPNLTKQN